MRRTSSHSLKFLNKGKRRYVRDIIEEYRRVTQVIIDDYWAGKVEGFNPAKNELELLKFGQSTDCDSWFSSYLMNRAANQAVGMCAAATEKRRKQLWQLAELQRAGKCTKRLQSKIDRQPLLKPSAAKINPVLSGNVKDFDESNSFTFARIGYLKPYVKGTGFGSNDLILPVKETRASRKWLARGVRQNTVTLSDTHIHLSYKVSKAERSGTQIVGADQGIATCLSLSNGVTTTQCPDGHTLSSICSKIARKKPGSKAAQRAREHRKNYINWSLNQIDWADTKEVRLEKLSNIGHGVRQPRFLKAWAYTLIREKLMRLGEEEGFRLVQVSNSFRSQRCSNCGWVRKANRKGKTFKCSECGHKADADLNAASNLELDLMEVPLRVRQKQINRKGFWWLDSGIFDSSGQELAVPATNKT